MRKFSIIVLLFLSIVATAQKKVTPIIDTTKVGTVNSQYFWLGDISISLTKGIAVADVLRLKIVDGDTLNASPAAVIIPLDSLKKYIPKIYNKEFVDDVIKQVGLAILNDKKELKTKKK